MIGIGVLVVLVVSFVVGLLTVALNRVIARFLKDEDRRSKALLGFFVILTSLASTYWIQSLVYIGSDEIGVVERKLTWSQKRLSPGRYVAAGGEVGVQADLLEPGLHFVPAIVSSVRHEPLVEIPQARIGIVEALDGKPLPADTEESPHEWREDGWYEPESFLGSDQAYRGIQRPPLRPGKHRLHPDLFRVIHVDTTLQVVRFGRGEPSPGSDEEPSLPGRMGELYVSANGTPLIANFRVNYRVTPESAYKAISKLGTEFHAKLLELVQSTARTTVRSTVEPLDLFDLKDDRDKYEEMIFKSMQKHLEAYGVELILADFTSIYAPSDAEGDSFRALEQQRSAYALEEETAKVNLLREQSRVELAGVRLEAIEAEALEERRAAEIEKENAQFRLEASRLAAISDAEEVRLLAEYLGQREAALYLAIREAAQHDIDVLPDVVVPNSGDALPAFLTERYLRSTAGRPPGSSRPEVEAGR